jgi:hypothetical protein
VRFRACHLVNEQLYHKPYPQLSRDQLHETVKELAKRQAMARDLATLALSFNRLTGSKAAEDLASSASTLAGDVDSLVGVKASSGEQDMLKVALKALISAIQEKKERDAAKAMDQVAKGMALLFKKEAPVWLSVDNTYADLASTLAKGLVEAGAVDNSATLRDAVRPYGLVFEPASSASDLNQKLAPVTELAITDRNQALKDTYKNGASEMESALLEMSERIHRVAQDKPMQFRSPPISVANVERWITEVASF